jgi:hypothetical protein
MVDRGRCILVDELRNKPACSSLDDMVSILNQVWSPEYKPQDLTAAVSAMFNAGSRYKNIEGRLGKGSWLVLGKVNPETT